MQQRDVEVSGRVQLAGAAPQGHGGVLVQITGQVSTLSDQEGNYLLNGLVNGDDTFLVRRSKGGYQTQVYPGVVKIPEDSVVTAKVQAPTITLTP